MVAYTITVAYNLHLGIFSFTGVPVLVACHIGLAAEVIVHFWC